MKEWPKDGKPVSFSDLTEPVWEAIRFAYKMERRNVGKDIPWNGLPKGNPELVSTFPVEQALNAENLRYSLEDQGRDALREILAVQVQLAFEQGRRIEFERIEIWLKLIDLKLGSREYTDPIREYLSQSQIEEPRNEATPSAQQGSEVE